MRAHVQRDQDGALVPRDAEPDIEAAASFPALTVPAGQTVSLTYSLYAGPKEFNRLDMLGDNQGELMNYDGVLPFSLLIVPMLTRRGTVRMPRFFHQIVNIVLALFAILIFGSVAFGWDIDRFLAGSAVASIVLGLALQESLGNFFSGLVMQAAPPFALGDWIICGDHEGRVVDMTWRALVMTGKKA